ncbi:pentapeptide repeat-containing protein [Pseudoalteromonas luteoviolacea]|uniref:pentapeptide repeat-containing protein n=1 Tax=Pseudoalteromonas luteoviolacea TaxID=43657 RepID=UPI001F30A953|nr:pentapeptide repeat-containing protein [Pseudoalteromonas luteoviolacea]MCF6439234.1 pentapeptide repeat-containing protein [Pseudoalteromonas luteoviolacea]
MEINKADKHTTHTEEHHVLSGDKALKLWLKGKNAWNAWMYANPNTDVSFEDVQFCLDNLATQYPQYFQEQIPLNGLELKTEKVICFDGFVFNGQVNFYHAKFKNPVSFNNAVFKGDVDFVKAVFLKDAHFSEVKFEQKAYFSEACFKTNVTFLNTTFSNSAVFDSASFCSNTDTAYHANFEHALFCENSTFSNAHFFGKTSFSHSLFDDRVHFHESCFSESAIFSNTTFKDNAFFTSSVFKKSIQFNSANFCKKIEFENIQFDDALDFKNAKFACRFFFKPKGVPKQGGLDFRNAKFHYGASLQGKFKFVPDLREINEDELIDLSTLIVEPSIIYNFNSDINKENAQRLSKLTELARKYGIRYQQTVRFNAQTLKIKKWIGCNPLKILAILSYSFISNYGQSIFRPFFFFVLSAVIFAQYTLSEAKPDKYAFNTSSAFTFLDKDIEKRLTWYDDMSDALNISIANALPFSSYLMKKSEKSKTALFKAPKSKNHTLFSYIHSSLTIFFAFLIALAYRNRYFRQKKMR